MMCYSFLCYVTIRRVGYPPDDLHPLEDVDLSMWCCQGALEGGGSMCERERERNLTLV